jgi:single-stranded DNA-binding protein
VHVNFVSVNLIALNIRKANIMSEFKKFDTQAVTHYFNVRLAKDAQAKEFGENTFVSATFVDSSRLDGDEEMWVEANVTKRNSALASYLEKGDVMSVSGKLTMRRWGDDNEKVAFNLRNAELHVSPGLLATLKERGWTPGSDEVKGAAPAKKSKPTAKGKVAEAPKKRGRPPGKTKIPVEIDLDDDEATDEGEEE